MPTFLGRIFSFLATVSALAVPARADVVVVPNLLVATEGNDGNAFPFGANVLPTQQRYQQVFAASQFPSFGVPVLITQIAFRPDATGGQAYSYTIPNIQINLSTAGVAPDGMSATFASNIGPNDAIVYQGSLLLTSAFVGPPGGPKEFDMTITLQTPFLYDPSAGNLLLDVRRFAVAGMGASLDSDTATGDSISRVYTNSTTPGGVNSPVGIADSHGLVTRFTFSPVPEPSSLALVGVALAGTASRRWRRRRS